MFTVGKSTLCQLFKFNYMRETLISPQHWNGPIKSFGALGTGQTSRPKPKSENWDNSQVTYKSYRQSKRVCSVFLKTLRNNRSYYSRESGAPKGTSIPRDRPRPIFHPEGSRRVRMRPLSHKVDPRDYTLNVENQSEKVWYWLAGFIEAEGSFFIAKRQSRGVFCYQATLSVSQHKGDSDVLYFVKKLVGVGKPRGGGSWGQIHYWEANPLGRFL